jgi:hypothetical protein
MTLMQCRHKRTKKKLIAWAISSRYGREQGFRYGVCCCDCGVEVKNMKGAQNETRL